MTNLKESIASIQESISGIVATVANLPEETIRWKPAPEIWSILEILCHVEEAVPYWSHEIERVIAHPGIEWGRSHQNETRLAAVAACSRRELEDVLTGLEKGRQKALGVLASLRDEDLRIESPSRNPRFGTKPMSFVLDHLLVAHLSGHLGQIRRNIEQFGASSDLRIS